MFFPRSFKFTNNATQQFVVTMLRCLWAIMGVASLRHNAAKP